MIASALHIGIDRYPAGYRLSVCAADARAWQKLFGGRTLLNAKAKSDAILDGIRETVAKPKRGEWAIITYSGHGCPVPDESGDEPDGFDEAIVAVNLEPVLDDEIHSAISHRRRGSRVLLIADSCYSGAVHRAMPVIGQRHLRSLRKAKARYLPASVAKPRAARVQNQGKQDALSGVVLLSACADFEFAYEGDRHGVWSGALLESYARHPSLADWFRWASEVVADSEHPQHPQLVAGRTAKRWKVPSN